MAYLRALQRNTESREDMVIVVEEGSKRMEKKEKVERRVQDNDVNHQITWQPKPH